MIRRSFPRFDFSTPERSWSLLRGLRRMRLALDRPWTVALWIGVMVTASTLFADGQLTPEKAQEENARADRFFSEARYNDAYDSYDKALITGDADVSLRARQGKIRSSLRLARFHMARYEAELMRTNDPTDADSLTLYADALWGDGLFDEAEAAYREAFEKHPASARARFGLARSLATHGRMTEALTEAVAASASAPTDVEILALVGELNERLYRYEDAIKVYETYVALMPKRLRNESDVVSLKLKLLRAFHGKAPVTIDNETTVPLHTVPFRLVNKKILVEASVNGHMMELVLDTGAERTALTKSAANRAGVKAIAETMITGVGTPGLRKLEVARVDSLKIGSLTIRDFPVSIRRDNMPGIPEWQNETFSPLGLGLSVVIDYQKHEVTMGRRIPESAADFKLPMRVYRLPMVRGVLNGKNPAYFVVDTGGELMSISTDVATQLAMPSRRKIALKVWGVAGLDPDAFLLPGVDLNFDDIQYRKQGMAVLNLRAPSVLLGFQLGGILGHRFLGSYRVAMDMSRGELRLQKF